MLEVYTHDTLDTLHSLGSNLVARGYLGSPILHVIQFLYSRMASHLVSQVLGGWTSGRCVHVGNRGVHATSAYF